MFCPPRLETLISTARPWLIVPRKTSSPGLFLIGFDSPVSELSSKKVSPNATTPSAGGDDPLRTRTMSPISRTDASISATFIPAFAKGSPTSGLPFSRSMDDSVVEVFAKAVDIELGATRRALVGRSFPRLETASAVRLLLYASRYRPRKKSAANEEQT